jgi:hypothetical protein
MEEKSLKEFLESVPPGKEAFIADFVIQQRDHTPKVSSPQIQLYCRNDECQGIRFFESEDHPMVYPQNYNNDYVVYICRNCGQTAKTFALGSTFDKTIGKWRVVKYGEVPSFGPPIPARALSLIGGEKDLFLLGRRNENQGMGIGAFVYYRRVIESQKNRIFDELIRVISQFSPDDAILAELANAKKENQFTKAVDSIKHALPQSLYINGHNPLTLLHSALSEGVHSHSDSQCLELASSVRAVLFDFAEKLGQALKEDAELKAAVNKLTKKK